MDGVLKYRSQADAVHPHLAEVSNSGSSPGNAPPGSMWREKHRNPLIVYSALAAFLLCGCQTPRTTQLPQRVTSDTPVALAAGDVVRLSFPGAPELNQSQKVRTDGQLNLPLIGEVGAAGKRVGEFQGELTRLYKSQLQDSNVLVTLESNVTPVFISGAVAKSGKLVLEQPTTVLEVIMEAGGFTSTANQSQVHLIRKVNGQHQTQIVDLSPALKGLPTPAVFVKRNDVIYVPERLINF